MLLKLEDSIFSVLLAHVVCSVELQVRFKHMDEKLMGKLLHQFTALFCKLSTLKVIINFVSDRFPSSSMHEN